MIPFAIMKDKRKHAVELVDGLRTPYNQSLQQDLGIDSVRQGLPN